MILKNLIASIVISLIALSVFGVRIQSAPDQKLLSQTETTTSTVEVDLRLVHKLSNRWEFELRATNKGRSGGVHPDRR